MTAATLKYTDLRIQSFRSTQRVMCRCSCLTNLYGCDPVKNRKLCKGFSGVPRSETFLRELQRKKTGGIIFSSSALASKFCFRAPDAVADLLKAPSRGLH